MENKVLGFCGVDCGQCPVYVATNANDFNKRKKVAKMLSKSFNMQLQPEDINCTGCVKATMEGTAIMGHCEACELRPCAKEKNVPTCAHCKEYDCEKLNTKWQQIPYTEEAKQNLKNVIIKLKKSKTERSI